MGIPASDVRGLFTKYVVETLEIKPSPTGFLKSFFKTKTTSAKNVSVEVKRYNEPIAVDVLRGAEGNMNSWVKSTEKMWTPPYFDERFSLNELDGYDRIFGQMGEVSADQFAMALEEAVGKVQLCKDKINRRYELMAAQVLTTGIVTLDKAEAVDFKRETASKGALSSGDYWTVTTVDPDKTLEAAAKFIRTEGLYLGSEFNVILGAGAWNAYLNNPVIQKKNNILNFQTANIASPIQFGAGSAFLGRVSAGSYIFNIWSYPQFYNNAGTTKSGKTPYIADNQCIVLPNEMSFTFAYAGVPHIARNPSSVAAPQYISYAPGEFFVDNFVDEKVANHIFAVKSAGIAIPTQVDAIYNKQVIA